MNKAKSNLYDSNFVKENMMGPNALKIIEELTSNMNLQKGMRVLDLGCGQGLTSIFLAKEYEVTVFATDLWIAPTENFQRFKQMKLENSIIPIHAEAHRLPYANEFFDAAISVDAYHYFGTTDDFLDKHLAPLVKKDGQIAVAIPGLKKEFTDGVPNELLPYWQKDMNFHTTSWWQNLWEKSIFIHNVESKEMHCYHDAWQDWLSCDNEYAKRDIPMMEAEAGNYFNLVSLQALKK